MNDPILGYTGLLYILYAIPDKKKHQQNSRVFTQWIKPRLPYDYHLIIIELGEEFEVQFECLGENTTMLS